MDQSSKKEADKLRVLNILKNPHLTITLVDQTKTASTSKKIKRTSSEPISNRSTKDAKYSSAISKIENNLCTISSKPNPVGSQENKKKENPICSCRWIEYCPQCNCRTKKPSDQKFSVYSIGDGSFSVDEIYKTPVGVYDEKNMVYIQIGDITYKSTDLHLSQVLSKVIHERIEKLLDDKELKILKQKYTALQYPTFDCSRESNNVISSSSNLRPGNNNITSSNTKQTNEVCKLKTQKINQPSKQTMKQKTNTSLKHFKTTATHSPTSNKHIISGNQLPMSSKHPMIVPTSKKPINSWVSVKSKIEYESVKGVVSVTDVCKKFPYPSLKNVTVTRINTPDSSTIP